VNDYTVPEVAALLDVSTKKVYADPTSIPGFYRLGRTIRFKREAFDLRMSLAEWQRLKSRKEV
jgi:hypothetical protein